MFTTTLPPLIFLAPAEPGKFSGFIIQNPVL